MVINVFIRANMRPYFKSTDHPVSGCLSRITAVHGSSALTVLTWAFYSLAKNPEVQEKCYNEIKKYYKGGKLDWEELKKMK